MPTSATVPTAIIPVTGLTTNGGVVGNGYEDLRRTEYLAHQHHSGTDHHVPAAVRHKPAPALAEEEPITLSSATAQSSTTARRERQFHEPHIRRFDHRTRRGHGPGGVLICPRPRWAIRVRGGKRLRDDVDFFRQVKHRNPALPGQVAVPFHKIRGYLLLAFLAIGLVVVGTTYASRTGGIGSARGKTPYGVAFESTIRPASEVRITSDAIGTVAEILVKVGDKVDKGQPLLRLSDAEAQLALQQAAGEREAAQANLDKFRARLADVNARVAVSQGQQQQVPTRQWRDSPERAQAAYDEALTNYNRAHELFEAGIVAKQELDNRTTELRLAKDDLDNAKKLASGLHEAAAGPIGASGSAGQSRASGNAGAVAAGGAEISASQAAGRRDSGARHRERRAGRGSGSPRRPGS